MINFIILLGWAMKLAFDKENYEMVNRLFDIYGDKFPGEAKGKLKHLL